MGRDERQRRRAPRKSAKYERRQPTSIALMLRKRIVLTIRNAGTSTIGSAGSAARGSCSPQGYRNTVAAMTAAGGGARHADEVALVGRPSSVWMLNRASRIAAAVT